MDALGRTVAVLVARQANNTADPNDPGQHLLHLIQNPFAGELQTQSIWASLGSSVGITAGIALAFSFLRPYNSVVYAPKLKHADEARAPPPLGRGVFAWLGPLWTTTETDLIRYAGLDAAVFMRFTTMLRNMFLVLAALGCAVLIPLNYTQSSGAQVSNALYRLTPLQVGGGQQWGTVAVAWLFNAVICGFLWWNYKKVLRLRRQYFESDEYQHSLHARTLMLYDIPKQMSSDQGIAELIDTVAPNSSFARTAVARNVKGLPQLIAEHEKTVRGLEKVLAKYLKDPANLPKERPQIKPSKHDRAYESYSKGQKVDAIEYLTKRIQDLELEIKEVRQGVDKRSSMPFGFASYSEIAEAHGIAYAARDKKPQGTSIKLAPRPSDIIWENMPMSSKTRKSKRFMIDLWIVLLTIVWIAPNAMIAIFLVNLSNLGSMWQAFNDSLKAHTTIWSIVQGIASPALTSVIFLLLPIVFRRMSNRAGDQTKTGRERHVTAKLYAFFIFNNLVVFSIFSAGWAFIGGVVSDTQDGNNAWEAIQKEKFGETMLTALCNISTFWVTYLLQRQLGAAIDLAQLWTLFYSFIMRKFSAPTPRELIELTAPPPFEYASYYNYFLYYATVALCYATIQPIVLPCAAAYFAIDVVLKKYLLLYIFVTKNESGGMSWRLLFNRMVFATILSNCVVFLVVFVRGDGQHIQSYCIAPLPFIMLGFKYYCAKAFDVRIHYYNTRQMGQSQNVEVGIANKENLRGDRLAAKFGHPALYRNLITPMVHAKAQNILASVYAGRLTDGREAGSGADSMSVSGYSDAYVMGPMKSGRPGAKAGVPGFEIVPEGKLDFEYYKNRTEFAEDHGAGDLFGTPSDIVRTGTPGANSVFSTETESRPGTPTGGMGFARSASQRQYSTTDKPPPLPVGYGQMSQPQRGQPGYQSPPGQGYSSPPTQSSPRGLNHPLSSPPAEYPAQQTHRKPVPLYGSPGAGESSNNLVQSAAPMASPPIGYQRNDSFSGSGGYNSRSVSGDRREASRDRYDQHSQQQHQYASGGGDVRSQSRGRMASGAFGGLGGGPGGYGNLPQNEPEYDAAPESQGYNSFRGAPRRYDG